jgi:hypothetical protein
MYMRDTELSGITDWLQSAGKSLSSLLSPTVTAPAQGTVNAPGAKVGVGVPNAAAVSAATSDSLVDLTKATPLSTSPAPGGNAAPVSNVPPASLSDVFGRFVSVLGEAVNFNAQANQPLPTNVGAPTNLSDIPGSSPVATMAATPPSGARPTSPPVTTLTRTASMPPVAKAPATPALATPAWLWPAAIGGGALLLLMTMGKRRTA